MNEDIKKHMTQILESAQPFEKLYQFAIKLRDDGFTQKEVYEIFDFFRDRHHDDEDETTYDFILDVMDYISGFCHVDYAIFKTSL